MSYLISQADKDTPDWNLYFASALSINRSLGHERARYKTIAFKAFDGAELSGSDLGVIASRWLVRGGRAMTARQHSMLNVRVEGAKVSTTFETELEMFGVEEIQAQQYFFGFLSLQLVPLRNPDVLAKMQETSLFWIATRYSLLMSAFVTLGRIFDQDQKSLHNIDKLLNVVSNEIKSLNKVALEQRKMAMGLSSADAARYVVGKHDLTSSDVREMRKAVKKWRGVYEARYRDIRHKIFAHKSLSPSDADDLMAKTDINEMKEMLGFLHALYTSLDQLYLNGIAPDLTPVTFALPPTLGNSSSGERIYRESAHLLYGCLINPEPEWLVLCKKRPSVFSTHRPGHRRAKSAGRLPA
jgi:hypothetical protein